MKSALLADFSSNNLRQWLGLLEIPGKTGVVATMDSLLPTNPKIQLPAAGALSMFGLGAKVNKIRPPG